jgi:hypothetical protein
MLVRRQALANISGAPLKGTLIGKKNTQAGDPTITNKANKKNVLVNKHAASERMGARYAVGEKFPAVHQSEVGPTMANARIVPSVMGRQAPDFNSGMIQAY